MPALAGSAASRLEASTEFISPDVSSVSFVVRDMGNGVDRVENFVVSLTGLAPADAVYPLPPRYADIAGVLGLDADDFALGSAEAVDERAFQVTLWRVLPMVDPPTGLLD